MLATELLMQDHREAEELMAQLQEADGEDSGAEYRPIFEQLKTALEMHMRAEEEIFYPAIEGYDELQDLAEHSYDEHAEVKALLAQLNELEPNTEEFQTALSTMMTGIEHHVEEEEDDMFPRAEEIMGEERLEELGRQIEAMKGDSKSSTQTASM